MEFGKAKEFFSQKLNFFNSEGLKSAQDKIAHAAANVTSHQKDAQVPQPPSPDESVEPAEAPPDATSPDQEEKRESSDSRPENMDVMVYDELLWANKYTYDEFVKSLNVKYQERGDTPEEKTYWSYRRRWRVRLYNLKIVNKMSDSLTCFAEFDFGGTRSECSVQMGSKTCILNKGESKQYIRTPVVENVTKEMSRDFNCTNTFEYHGSYLDLEHEKLRIKLWKCRKYTINCLESVYEEYLIKYVKGDIFVEIPMYKFEDKEKKLRCKISFDLFFQELYDFELSFINWKVNGIKSSVNLFNRKPVLQEAASNQSTEGDETSKDAGNAKSDGTDKKSARIENVLPVNNSTRGTMHRPTRMNRIRYFIFRLKLRKKWKAENIDACKVSSDNSEALQMKKESDMTEYERLLVKRSLLIKDDPYMRPEPEVPKKYLPSPRLRIRIKSSNGHRVGGLELVSHVIKNESNAHWSNIGELVFRGTLMDLQKSELEISVLDAKAPNAVNCVGYTLVSLGSITDYPFLISKLNSPNWLKLKANIEGWNDNLDKWSFGSIHGKVEIHRKPQYRQTVSKSASVTMGNSPTLIVHIKAVDQLITDVDLTSINSFAEVSFAGQTYSTQVYNDLFSPFWNEEITFALAPPLYAGIDCEFFLRCGLIRISVWGYSSDLTSGIIYFGSTCLHPCEIFYTPKGELRQKSQTTHKGYNSKYETRVFSGKRKLHLLQDDDRTSNITFSAWIFPDHNVQSVKTFNLPQEIMQQTQINMCGVNTETYKELESYWNKIVALRPGETGKVIHRAITEYNEGIYLPCLVAPMHPPPNIDNENAIFHMIRCIPFVSKQFARVYTPGFLMKIKRGHALDHAILFCSYLRGMLPPVEAYVCLGSTTEKKAHAWVMTLYRNTKTVKLWETTNGERYLLRDVFINDESISLNPEDKYNGKIPYMTLDAIFNEQNLWLNVQESLDPQYIFYNVERLNLFCPFMPKKNTTAPCYPPKINYAIMNKYELEKLNIKLKNQLERSMNLHRTAQNLQTKWNNTPELQAFLEKGLRLVHTCNTCSDDNVLLVKRGLQEWKNILRKRVPQSYQLLGTALHFNTVDPESILDPLRHTLNCIDSREMYVTFAISTLTKSLPGDLYSVYLYVLYTCKVHERVRRTLAMKQERLSIRKKNRQSVKISNEVQENEKEEDEDDEEDGGDIWINGGMTAEDDDESDTGADITHTDLVDKISRNLSIQNRQFTRKKTTMAGLSLRKTTLENDEGTPSFHREHSSESFSEVSHQGSSIDPIISRNYSSKFSNFENLPSIDIEDLHSGKFSTSASKSRISSSSILKTLLTSENFPSLSTLGSQAFTSKFTSRLFSGSNAPQSGDFGAEGKSNASSKTGSSSQSSSARSRMFLESKSRFLESRNDFPSSSDSTLSSNRIQVEGDPPADAGSKDEEDIQTKDTCKTEYTVSSSWSSSGSSDVVKSAREDEQDDSEGSGSEKDEKPIVPPLNKKLQNFLRKKTEAKNKVELPCTETLGSELSMSECGNSVGRLDTVMDLSSSCTLPDEATARLVSIDATETSVSIPSSSDFSESKSSRLSKEPPPQDTVGAETSRFWKGSDKASSTSLDTPESFYTDVNVRRLKMEKDFRPQTKQISFADTRSMSATSMESRAETASLGSKKFSISSSRESGISGKLSSSISSIYSSKESPTEKVSIKSGLDTNRTSTEWSQESKSINSSIKTSSVHVTSDWDSSSIQSASSGSESGTLGLGSASSLVHSDTLSMQSSRTSSHLVSSRSSSKLSKTPEVTETSSWSSVKLSSEAPSRETQNVRGGKEEHQLLKRPSKLLAEMLVKKVSMQQREETSDVEVQDTARERDYKKVGVFGLFV
ncbi:hypothetical protein BEWA_003380 [Theileria equi strain WA]|uniref:C2 domain-containing protein n=1 Tax=Theileria equi strain WA TaxID=1537102 RepID=L0AZF2_THEEQ|nr:hypothetical protein BEWA_003380 [Theileria equi strain WA]AFZ80930.1 hypothetical protein BEWA_003380 [Theileria equi strain WA]|eukprot:XP_004830596.1 hypothetical protein BEWA_003380 [Theileria equi strain WA]